jgi:hypothetical protein
MTELYVTNSLNLHKTVKFNLTLRYFVIKGERGKHMWTLEVGTTHEASDGSIIPSARVHNISMDNLDDAIEQAVSSLCTYIDWSPYVLDKEAPYVESHSPDDGETDVKINRNVYVTLKDFLPSAGIDLSSIKVYLHNSMVELDITSQVEITGDPYEYEIYWRPPYRIYDTYD